MNAATIKTLSTSEISSLLIQVNDSLNAARSAFRNDTSYVARMQPVYEALLAEWNVRYPANERGASCG